MTDDVGQIVALVVGLLLAMAGLLYALGRMEQWMTGSTAGSKALPPVADAAMPDPVTAEMPAPVVSAPGLPATGPPAPVAPSLVPAPGPGASGSAAQQFAATGLGTRVVTVDGREEWPADLGAAPAPGGRGEGAGRGRARHATRRSGAHTALRRGRGRSRRDENRSSAPDEHLL